MANLPASNLEDLLSNYDIETEGIEVRKLTVPKRIEEQWLSVTRRTGSKEISYAILQGKAEGNFCLRSGDMFNAILMRSASPDRDFRLFQFTDQGYFGYSRHYSLGISDQETMKQDYMKVGLVYRFEAVTFKRGQEGFLFFARPMWLVIGDSATKVDFKRFELSLGDQFYLKVLNFNNRHRLPYGKFLSYSCFIRNIDAPLQIEENLFVEVIDSKGEMAYVRTLKKNQPEEEYDLFKKRVFKRQVIYTSP